ncbi:hypothetical protein IFR05_009233 [Cadophora sp. M221]|nr:hypothetical protein IFR05_009233 [Cadophora sp. M221]
MASSCLGHPTVPRGPAFIQLHRKRVGLLEVLIDRVNSSELLPESPLQFSILRIDEKIGAILGYVMAVAEFWGRVAFAAQHVPSGKLLAYRLIRHAQTSISNVLAVGITAAVKLRLVCHIFYKEIPAAMINAGLLAIEHRWLFFPFPNKSWLVEEYIYLEQKISLQHFYSLPTPLLPRICQLRAAQSLSMSRKLSNPTFANLAAQRHRTFTHAHKSDTNLIEAAAAYLVYLDFFIRLLGEKGAIDASEPMYFGNPLRNAILQDNFDLLAFLLDNGVDVNHGERGKGFSKTALQAAASTGRHRFIELLLHPRYGCRTSGRDFESAVLSAVFAGHLPIVRYLMEIADMVPTPEFCNRILLEAAKYGWEEIVKFALQMGADPNKSERCYGFQIPITAAARSGYAAVVRILLENGTVVARIGGRYSTVNAASRGGGWDGVIRVLLEYVSEGDVRDVMKWHQEFARWVGEKAGIS